MTPAIPVWTDAEYRALSDRVDELTKALRDIHEYKAPANSARPYIAFKSHAHGVCRTALSSQDRWAGT